MDDYPNEPGDEEYIDLARRHIIDLIDREHAVVWHEVEARLAEVAVPGAEKGINPHFLTNARRQLLDEGVIEVVTATARGGREIAVYGLLDRRRRKTAFERAAGRKRLLETRYLGWAGGSVETNAIGSAGELVTHVSLQRAASEAIGYRVLSTGGQVRQLFVANIPGGPIDNAALLIGDNIAAPRIFTIMVEVKNLRPWLYPPAVEIYQLLHKAAQVQIQQPNQHIMPVLVARRVHYLTFVMAKHLGFFIVQFDGCAQPIRELEFVDPHFVDEIRDELGYNLVLTDGTGFERIYRAFRYTIPRYAQPTAERWARMGPDLAPHFARLRNRNLTARDRDQATDLLYRDAVRIATPRPRWRTV